MIKTLREYYKVYDKNYNKNWGLRRNNSKRDLEYNCDFFTVLPYYDDKIHEITYIYEHYEQYMMFWEMKKGNSENMYYSRKVLIPYSEPDTNLRLSFNKSERIFELYIEKSDDTKIKTIVVGNAKDIAEKLCYHSLIKINKDGTELVKMYVPIFLSTDSF